MKKINFKKINIKVCIIVLMLVFMVGLLAYGVVYAINNHNRDDIMSVNSSDYKYTLNQGQLDGVSQPKVNLEIKYDKLPENKNTIDTISIATLKKLFQTSKKSIVVLTDDNCSFSQLYIPKLTRVLEKYNLHAYAVNLTTIKESEVKELFNYIDYEATPTTYIISNSKVNHTLTGDVDEESLISFLDYFYARNN